MPHACRSIGAETGRIGDVRPTHRPRYALPMSVNDDAETRPPDRRKELSFVHILN
jgi:hypothetical protein